VATPLWALPLGVAFTIIGVNLRQIVFAQFPNLSPRFKLPDLAGRANMGHAILCILFASYILGAFRFDPDPRVSGVILFVLFFLLQWLGGFRLCHRGRHRGSSGWLLLIAIPLVCAACTSALLSGVWKLTGSWVDPDVGWLPITVGPPMILIVWTCGTILQIGLMGGDFPDAAREWLTRLVASVSIAIVAWPGLFVVAVFGPYWLACVALSWAPAGPTLVGGWILSRIGGYLSAKSEKTKGGPPEEGADLKTRALELLAKVSPVVFLAGFLLLVSLGTHLLLRAVTDHVDCMVPVTAKIPNWLLWLEPVRREYWCFLFYSNHGLLSAGVVLLSACAVTIAILLLRLNIDEFSMHHFDKDRLVRCFLGASRERRQPNRLTGSDPYDDFPISTLLPSHPVTSYRGPYPIVNCALNLNTGSELARQELRAASFVFTPRYCGFDPPHSKEVRAVTAHTADLNVEGYRATPGYMEPAGPGLGTAIAISSAAATHTSTPLALLMTILNVRLGWWLGNPRRDRASAQPGPSNALLPLLSELFGQSSGRSRYVNVSDGGYFDHFGLYELVRRRCRYIIVCDSEADPALGFESLRVTIRKCRADLGVEISINPEPIRLSGGRSRSRCVVGTVTYPEPEAGFAADACGRANTTVPSRATGWLLYLNAAFAGDEPGDSQQFPQVSTAHQAFSESQFEGLRQLGLQVVRTTFENVATRPSTEDERHMLAMFQDLSRKSYPAPFQEGKASNLNERYSAFLRRLSEDAELAFLDNQFFDGMPPVSQPQVTPRKAIYFCIELIQFMEAVYVELNFQHRGDRENPAYAGWNQVFFMWANSQAVREAWHVAGSGFSPLFQEYFEGLSTRWDS
jgi:hypothetical protein